MEGLTVRVVAVPPSSTTDSSLRTGRGRSVKVGRGSGTHDVPVMVLKGPGLPGDCSGTFGSSRSDPKLSSTHNPHAQSTPFPRHSSSLTGWNGYSKSRGRYTGTSSRGSPLVVGPETVLSSLNGLNSSSPLSHSHESSREGTPSVEGGSHFSQSGTPTPTYLQTSPGGRRGHFLPV